MEESQRGFRESQGRIRGCKSGAFREYQEVLKGLQEVSGNFRGFQGLREAQRISLDIQTSFRGSRRVEGGFRGITGNPRRLHGIPGVSGASQGVSGILGDIR